MSWTKEDAARYAREWRRNNHDRWSATDKARRKRDIEQLLNAYGRVCTCCGESNPLFLTLDHINNNGAEHRKKLGIGRDTRTLRRILRLQGYPPRFQTLCFNCNCGKQRNGGTCPHKKGDIANGARSQVVRRRVVAP